jgi:hypothetical protein
MIEQYISGPLVSYEVLVNRGRPLFLGVTDRNLSPFPTAAEIGYAFPADVPAAHDKIMRSAVTRLVEHMGVVQAFLHCEFILTAADAHLVEINPRLPGALVTFMLRDCLDADFYQLVATSALGGAVRAPGWNGLYSGGYIAYAPRRAVALADSDTAAARAYPFVVDVLGGVQTGAAVGPASDYKGAVGHVRTVVGSRSLAGVAARAAGELLVPPLGELGES